MGRRTSEGFVVFKDSELSSKPTKICPDNILRLRKRNLDRVDANFVLTEDTLFSSPSAAAGFVTYASANGMIMWLTEDGKPLKEVENEDE